MTNREKKGYDRNYFALLFEGVSFVSGITIMATGGAVALFIDVMTGSKTLVGLAITSQILFLILGQLAGAPYVNTIRNLPKTLFKLMTFQRSIPIIMAIPLFLMFRADITVYVFLVLFGLFWFMDGVVTMSWGELTARAIKPELRGHMMGMQVAIAGAISLLTGALLAWLLATPALTDHYRFGFVFILTAVLVLASIIFIRIVKDPNPTPAPEKYDFRKYYARILPFIKTNKALRHVLIARMPGYIGFTVLSFMVVFGANTLDLSGTQISLLVYSKIVGALIGGFVLAETSRRLGNKAVILLCNVGVIITLLMATALIYIPALGYIWLISLCIFAALWQNNWLGYMNYIIDISPTDDRPAFQVIGSVIGIPFSFAGFALGAVIDYWGFLVAFIICGISAVMALVTSLRLLSRKRITQGDGSLGL